MSEKQRRLAKMSYWEMKLTFFKLIKQGFYKDTPEDRKKWESLWEEAVNKYGKTNQDNQGEDKVVVTDEEAKEVGVERNISQETRQIKVDELIQKLKADGIAKDASEIIDEYGLPSGDKTK